MPNLYRETAGPSAPAPPLAGDVRADVVVVGGGFTGLSTALHLAQKGAAVVLLEAEEPGWGASGRNGGQVNPGLKPDPDVVEGDFGADLGGRMNALAGAAPDLVFDLIERHGIACDARRGGTLRAAVRERHAAAVRATAEQLARRNAPVEILSGAALAAATGTDRYAVAMLDRRGGDLNPLKFARGLARAAVAAGAAVHGRTRALGLTRRGGDWTVRTNSGTATAAHVVLATNGYSDELWPGLRRSIVPVFGAIAATAALPPALQRAIMPSRAVLYESGLITVYYRVDSGGRLLIGGRGPQHEVTSTRPLGHLLRYARRLWPGLDGVEWTHAWGGRLAMTRDHYPHIHELAPGLVACLGYNGRGVAMATAMGAQLAKRILDPTAAFDMPVSRMRPIALHAAWPLAVHATIARGRISDFLGR
jgi:glycine/D-amino acid oxidase-like deaminating enzyme